ncbi:hypothetical protein [Streptomyces scabiei]|uniref:hypothetical protein n=1 Tax=Streptomyces scabiei TaxID=1930 RepID=UPI0029BE8720|nr:hypothetical protein [Streptomyces scabiei]MDX2538581.1 hypothetical protein [Streptomyces scabiei]MDX2799855.1 hypothetical protein [Streptomyces scabiei]MDX2855536.1 hypothetical protein [Streptomyces scabiei]MDX3278066.1 hypothetical protein [Streptomyces scabiei]MDX3828510.1 hypothetical protein [Streptomyces scabiei]
MVEGLPPDGALARKASGHHWQHADFMLADLIDQVMRLRVDNANANRGEKQALQPYPEPVWRPGQPSKKQKAKKARKDAATARAGYLRIVSIVTPQYAEKG